MKLPGKIWVSRKWIKHSPDGQKPDASFVEFQDSDPYIPEAEAERLREVLRNLVVCCEHEAAFRGEKPHAFVVAGREALGVEGEK